MLNKHNRTYMNNGELEATVVFNFIHSNYVPGRKQIFVLEGSSGSSKTQSIIQFLNYYCQINDNVRKKITAARAKMTWVRDSIWNDTVDYLKYHNFKFGLNKTLSYIELFGNKISFKGADDPQRFHGPRQDVTWFNEAMELTKKSFDQLNQRTNELVILDYNPSMEKHWIFDTLLSNVEIIPGTRWKSKIVKFKDERGSEIEYDVFFDKSTYKDNPYLPEGQRAIILGYDPSNPENVKNGTADDYMYKVYALGVRTAPKGLIFKNWNEYNELDHDYDYIQLFGIDWGGNDPTTLIEVNFRKDKPEMYIKEHLYQPLILNNDLAKLIKEVNPRNIEVVCDSARKDPRFELINYGINAIGATKGQGSIVDGINNMKQYNIFIHKDSENIKREFNTYRWIVDPKTDKELNVPEDNNNHAIDPARYCTRYYHLLYGYNYK